MTRRPTGRFLLGIIILSLHSAEIATQSSHAYRDGYAALGNELTKLDQLFRIGHQGQYDRRQTPAAALGEATRVNIEMYIRSFGSVNPIQMDYTVDLYLRQRWLEARFLNNTLTRPLDLNDPILVKMLWKPEVYFPNAKESDFQYVTVPNVMLRVHPDGSILYILRLKLTFSCMMDLSSYPLDHQTCYIQLASFVKTTRELELVWYDDPVKMYKHLKLPQFQIKGIRADTCSQSFHIGNYSCLQAAFELRRNVGYHLVQSYLPTSLIVVVSWVSFWLDVDAIPSRVTLGVTTLLTVCSESTSFRDKMPIVSYVKALDIWMGSCTAFVFLALVEFTVVSHLARHHRRFIFWGSNHGHRAFLYETHKKSCSNFHSVSRSDYETANRPTHPHTTTTTSSTQQQDPIHLKSTLTQPAKDSTTSSITKTNGCEDKKPHHENPDQEDSVRHVHIFHTDTEERRVSNTTRDPWRLFCADYGRSDISGMNDNDLIELPSLWREKAILAKRIDMACRVVFPAVFTVFNIVYWTYYEALSSLSN